MIDGLRKAIGSIGGKMDESARRLRFFHASSVLLMMGKLVVDDKEAP